MKTQRDTFWDTIYDKAKHDRDIIVISADMGAPALDKFRRDFPHQYINTGIAEQNSILVAAGLAKEGKKVFVYAIASFLTLNCIEKIRVQCSMMKIPINIVGVGAGFSYPDSGPTHHLVEDISVMRAMPFIDTFSITDSVMAEQVALSYREFNQSTYIRLERQNFGEIYSQKPCLISGLHEIITGKNKLIISNGAMLSKVFQLHQNKNSSVGLLDLYKFPINLNSFKEVVSKYNEIIVIEEHFLPGGLGSAVLEAMNELGISIPVKRLGLHHEKGYCYNYGGRDEILKYYNLCDQTISQEL